MIYVMSDIHGYYYKLMAMLNMINLRKEDTLFILGDVLDRGPDSIKCLQWVMRQKNVKMILGNHEAMLLEGISGNDDALNCWFGNGGQETFNDFMQLSDKVRNDLIIFLKGLPLYYTVNNVLLVHAGVMGPIKKDQLKCHFPNNFLWVRDLFYKNKAVEDMITIFGHTPTQYIDKDSMGHIWKDTIHNDKIGIDCGVQHKKGHLGCLCLDTMDEYYV